MSIGEKFLMYRATHDLTQKQLADALGVNVAAISRAESGRNKMQKAREIKFTLKLNEMEKNENEKD